MCLFLFVKFCFHFDRWAYCLFRANAILLQVSLQVESVDEQEDNYPMLMDSPEFWNSSTMSIPLILFSTIESHQKHVYNFVVVGPVLLQRSVTVAILSANGSAAFKESGAPIC